MFDCAKITQNAFLYRLGATHRRLFGTMHTAEFAIAKQLARFALDTIATSDAPYHDLEHTLLVTDVGQMVLLGRQQRGEPIAPTDWVHMTVALLFHDVGYVKGACQGDRLEHRTMMTAQPDLGVVQLPPGATDAALTPYHVDRSQQALVECVARLSEAHQARLDLQRLHRAIERTRFPVPADPAYDEIADEPGLCRAADLIGQLSDRRYLQKLPALFREFQETGCAANCQYHTADDLRQGFPNFFWTVAYPYLTAGIAALQMTESGQQVVQQLFNNVDQATPQPISRAL